MNHPNPNPFDNGLHPQVYPSIPQQPQQQAYATSSLGYPQQQPPQPQQQQQQQQPIQQPQLQQQLPPQQSPFLQTITTAVRINDFNETEKAVVDQLYLSNHPKAKTLLRIGFMLGSFSMFCTCLWLLTTPARYFWPLHIIYASCMAWALVFVMGYPSITSAADNGQGASVGWSNSQKLFAVHGAVSFLTCAMLIVMNFMAGRDYPWAVFPVATMMGLFAIHANYKAFSPLFSHFSVHFIVYVTINFVLLVVYCYDRHSHGAPWFLIVWAAWGFCLLIHLIAYRANKLNKERRMLLEQQQQQQQIAIEEQPVLQSSTIPAYPPQHHAAPAMMRQATLAPHQMMPPQQQQSLPPVRMYPGPPRSLSPNVQQQQQGSYQQSLYQ